MSWSKQSENDDFTVKVSGDYCKDGEERTDFLIIDRETGEHAHVSVDVDGEITISADYYKVFCSALIEKKLDIFRFVQAYYRCFMGKKSIAVYPKYQF